MKALIVPFLRLFTATALLSSCAFDKNDPSADRVKEREKDRSKLVEQLSPVEGRYVGKLEFFDRPNQMSVDVELGLILEEENAGVDSDGLPIARPTLKAYFKRADDLNLGLIFKANFNKFIDPNSQNLILTNPSMLGEKPSQGAPGTDSTAAGSTGSQEITSIRGKLENQVITANVLTGAGVLGKITLTFKDKTTEASSLGLQNDINAKVTKLFKRIEGTYEGSVQIGKILNPVVARVTLTAAVNSSGKPVLKAYYERLDVYPVVDFNQELNVDYKTESYPQQISLVGSTGNGFNFNGIIYSAQEVSNKTCINNYVDKECEYYLQGDIVISKNTKVPLKLVRIKDRTQPKELDILGTYKGFINFSTSRPPVSLTVSLFVQEESGGTDSFGQAVRRPVIKAYVQRSDAAFGSTYSVSYNDLGSADKYNLVIFSPTNPQMDIVSLRGNVKAKSFAGEVMSASGTVGRAGLVWTSADALAPGDGINNENNENLLKVYQNIAGTYQGTVDFKTPEVPAYVARFELKAVMGAGKPMLLAYYTRSDDIGGELSLDLAVDYKPDTYPQRITMSTASSNTGRVYIVNLDGYLQNGVISGTFLAPKGRTASVTLKKVTKK